MWYIVISLIGLGVVAAIAGYFRNKKLQKMLEREVEVAGWLRSLQLRGINLPDALKDEAFLIIGERRTH